MHEDEISRIDQRKLYKLYEHWDQHFYKAAALTCAPSHSSDFYDGLYFCGMGGSATSGEICSDLLLTTGTISSLLVKGQKALPSRLGKRSLVIVTSASGNTEESLSMFEAASERGAEVIAISAGGKLREAAVALGHNHIDIPNLSIPRASLPYLLMPSLKIVEHFMPAKFDYDALFDALKRTLVRISINVPHEENISKQISSFLKNDFAFCYSSPYLFSATTRFKNSLNENAKVHCSRESVLEASHNEIVPFTFLNNRISRKVILLEWKEDEPFVCTRFSKVKTLFNEIGQSWMELRIPEPLLLNAILSAIYILDYATVYMAIANNLDPSPTPAIDILKRIKPF